MKVCSETFAKKETIWICECDVPRCTFLSLFLRLQARNKEIYLVQKGGTYNGFISPTF